MLAPYEELKGISVYRDYPYTRFIYNNISRYYPDQPRQSESVPVKTNIYASTLTANFLLILEFFSASQDIFSELSESAGKCELALHEVQSQLADIVTRLGEFTSGYYFGNGSGYTSAMEADLKMKEMALFHTEGCESWEMVSGSATMVN